MDFSAIRSFRSRGIGVFLREQLGECGLEVVIEEGVRIVHPENVYLGDGVFIGNDSYFDAYHSGRIDIAKGSWIGQQCFFHGAGSIRVGRAVGIGPKVTILTSQHEKGENDIPVLHGNLIFKRVDIHDGADIGAAAVLLPGVTIGEGAVVGAGVVVTRDVPAHSTVVGNPAELISK